MEDKKLTISPKEELKQVLDYESLRSLGMSYIENLGNKYWTDYNTHDPGITILEALCYALTELGYRMQFPMQDLLKESPAEAPIADSRFTARQILTTHPVTTLDYRKLLIDLNGVANAWLAKVDDWQPDIYANCKEKTLQYDKTEHKLNIRGIWDILLELENSDEFGDLNDPGFDFIIPEEPLKGKSIEFIAHNRVNYSWRTWLFGQLKSVTILKWSKESNTEWKAKLEYRFLVDGNNIDVAQDVTIFGRDLKETNPDNQLKKLLKEVSKDSLQEFYVRRERAVLDVLIAVANELQDNRNLCEDFRQIGLVSSEEISFCADIETDPEADLELIEAQIILAIEDYLTPNVSFYSLQEMLDSGTPTEEIFEGPALDHGFIDTEELAASQLREAVYTSDIINILMDIEGVNTVSNFVMSKFNAAGDLVKKGEPWALTITKNHKPRYSRSKSKWLFFKNRIPFATRDSEVDDILQLLKAEAERGKLLNRILDLDLPAGKFRELDQYFSIQNDLPETYGVSDAGFPSNATQERKNQAKQLQGYLQFYDQILANFLAQVENFKNYISLETAVDNTYFAKFLETLPGSDYIYKDAIALEADLMDMAEDEELFLHRRNKVLDHLLSRFQESFNNYVLMLYTLDGDEKAGAELILDKIKFLKNYPELSSRRFIAINYTKASAWPYFDSAGLKQRVSGLAGINETAETYLMPIRIRIISTGLPADDTWSVIWETRDTAEKLFKLKTDIKGRAQAKLAARKAFQKFVEGGYSAAKAGSKWRAMFGKAEYDFRSTKLFESSEEAVDFAEEWYNFLNDAEGMNLIEHILLRPNAADYLLMDACIPDDCKFCGDEDPYSFKFSIVLPYWPTRFRKIYYRKHLEQLVHEESPAHLLPKVCWADPLAWQELEDAWQDWLEQQEQVDEEPKKHATARLIKALEDVETVYPEAVLHDCEDDKDENPVILNQTKLGIF